MKQDIYIDQKIERKGIFRLVEKLYTKNSIHTTTELIVIYYDAYNARHIQWIVIYTHI